MTPTRPAANRLRGFTLIELLAVILIMLVITAIILRLSYRGDTHTKIQRCKAEIKLIATAMDGYFRAKGQYPYNLSDALPYGSFSTTDPWGTDWRYTREQGAAGLSPGRDYNPNDVRGTMNAGNTSGYGYTVTSNGPDGIRNTSDDIGSSADEPR